MARNPDEAAEQAGAVRLDKWLWAARCFKTRSLATAACEGGHCSVDGRTGKAGQRVRPGMRVEVLTPGGLRVLEILALADKRGPAEAARALFVDHSPPPPEPDPVARLQGRGAPFARERGAGRPTKRDRRLLDRRRFDPQGDDS